MFRNKCLLVVICALDFMSAHAEAPHLTLDDIDQLARDKVVRKLKEEGGGTSPGQGGPALSAPMPGPAPVVVRTASQPAARTEPVHRAERVSFLGAYSDGSGTHVLYEYRNAVYPALVGASLLNGWKVTKVDGYLVTVTEGKGKPWTEPIAVASTIPDPSSSPVLRALTDLGGPLPPGGAGAYSPAPMAPAAALPALISPVGQ